MRKRLDIVVNNHMDLLWRRCFARRFENEGRVFASYQDIEEYYIEDNLRLCERFPEYKFQIESVAVVRAYLARNPGREDALKRLYREGRLRISGAGDNIVDGNLSGGESLVRNFVLGQLYLRRTFGRIARLANRDDAFGNCAQLPQILRGCGMRWVKGLSYTACPRPYWRGLDGSLVYTRLLPVSGMAGGWRKYAPCPQCGGSGTVAGGRPCPACEGRGIDRAKNETERQPVRLQTPLPDRSTVMAGGEEIVPDASIVRWKEQFSDPDVQVRFALEEDQYEDLKDRIECDAPAADEVFAGELNPNNTGCYTTRIRTKQLARAAENRLLRLETLCTMAALRGAAWPREALEELWRRHLFTLFHDAVTATHIDPAYQELLDDWRDMEAVFEREEQKAWNCLCRPAPSLYSVVNHTGFAFTGVAAVRGGAELEHTGEFVDENGCRYPVLETRAVSDGWECKVLVRGLEPFGGRELRPGTAEPARVQVLEPRHPAGIRAGILQAESESAQAVGDGSVCTLENARYRVQLGRQGILQIDDKQLGRTIAESADGPAVTFFLEEDIGSPWASVMAGAQAENTARYAYLHKIERTDCLQRAWYLIDLPPTLYGAINSIGIEYSVTLYRDVPYVEFAVKADWDTYNTRLRMAVYTPLKGSGLYETPYGVQERQPYQPTFRWTGANGDWPAWNFFGVSAENSVALFNQGTPSSRVLPRGEGAELSVSLLRSPTMPTYLHEPDAYTMREFDGMRDTGRHRFRMALAGYALPLTHPDVIRDAHNFNAVLKGAPGAAQVPAMPRLRAQTGYVSCLKRAEDGDGWICRIVECTGRGGSAELYLPAPYTRAERVDLLEQLQETMTVRDSCVQWELRPFEICTLRIR